MNNNVVFYWSGGKDSAMALYAITTEPQYEGHTISGLLTTLTDGYDRISGHGVRRALLERQAICLGLPLNTTYIPKNATMSQYESVMAEVLFNYKRTGISIAATGDLFVEKQRMATFKKARIKGCFPLMLRNSHEHVRQFIDLGFKAYIVCVDSTILDKSFIGRLVDRDFLNQLPTGIDPCGENGEFHTFVFDGPIFKEQVKCKLGEVVLRESFYFCDVLQDN